MAVTDLAEGSASPAGRGVRSLGEESYQAVRPF
jgi:hypothetical protein